MFKIITTSGNEIGVTETINYIKISPSSGCFIAAKKEDAVGIAYRGTPYNLFGNSIIENAETVFLKEFDGGEELQYLTEENDKLKSQLAETDEAAIELYELNMMEEKHNAEQDEAIIEIYEMMGDISNG